MHVDLSRPSPYDQSNGLLPIYSALHNSVDRDSLNSGRADQLARLQAIVRASIYPLWGTFNRFDSQS
jgi:hypothetical protein